MCINGGVWLWMYKNMTNSLNLLWDKVSLKSVVLGKQLTTMFTIYYCMKANRFLDGKMPLIFYASMQIMIIFNLFLKFFNKHLQQITRDFKFELRLWAAQYNCLLMKHNKKCLIMKRKLVLLDPEQKWYLM